MGGDDEVNKSKLFIACENFRWKITFEFCLIIIAKFDNPRGPSSLVRNLPTKIVEYNFQRASLCIMHAHHVQQHWTAPPALTLTESDLKLRNSSK